MDALLDSRKKTGNDQVGGKAFARAERAPVPFAVICLCIGDHEALAAQLHGAFAVDGFQNQIALIVGVPVGNGGREPGFQYVDHALQPFGGNGTILSNGLASVVQRFALVNDFRNAGNPADNAVQRYAADAGQIVADGDAVLFGRIQIFNLFCDVGVVVLFQRLIPDAQRRVQCESLLFVPAHAGKVLNAYRIVHRWLCQPLHHAQRLVMQQFLLSGRIGGIAPVAVDQHIAHGFGKAFFDFLLAVHGGKVAFLDFCPLNHQLYGFSH